MFLKGGKAATAAPGRSGGTFSYIGGEMTVTGDIATDSELHLDGKVVGDVSCGALTQGESGEVRGNIRADEARLAGLVDGAVEAGTHQAVFNASGLAAGTYVYRLVLGSEVQTGRVTVAH